MNEMTIRLERNGAAAVPGGQLLLGYAGNRGNYRLRIEQRGDNHLFITRGDANQIEDPIPVTQDLLVGRVVFVSAALGVLVSLLTNPLVFGLLILLPLLILLIANLVRTVRLSARLAREEEEKAIREALEEARKKRESNEKTES